MSSRPARIAVVAVALLAPLDASAQLPPPPAARPAAPAPAVAAPAKAAGAAPTAPLQPTGLANIQVTDPMLTPVPPARKQLGGWQDAINLIKARSPDLIIGVQEVEKARGQARIALAGALPTITGTGTYTHNFVTLNNPSPDVAPTGSTVTGNGARGGPTIPSNDSLLGTLVVNQALVDTRKWYAIGTTRNAVRATQLTYADRERTVALGVANAIITVVTDERISEVNRVGLTSSLQVLELTERKQRLGSGTKLDVVRAQQDVAAARLTLVAGDESLLQAREALGLALGTSEEYGVSPNVTLNEMGAALRTMCNPGKVEDRPDVLSAKATLETNKRLVTDSELAYAPTLYAVSTMSVSTDHLVQGGSETGTTPTTTPQVFQARNYAWSIQGILTIPIWEGGARYGATRIAKANVEEQKANVEFATNQAVLQNTQAVRNVGVAETSRSISEQNRDFAKEQARLTKIAFEAGTGTSFDLVAAQKLERDAELDLATKEFAVVQTRLTAMLSTANCNY